jgi:hypothetical protein
MNDYAPSIIALVYKTKKLHDAFLKNHKNDAVLLASEVVDVAQQLEDLAIELGKEKLH